MTKAKAHQVLFVQGAGESTHDTWDNKLVDSLRRTLGNNYEVRYPKMPNEADPKFASWSVALEHELATLQDGAIVIGHSVGGTILVNTIASLNPNASFAAIVLLAAPFVGKGGWPAGDVPPHPHLGADLPKGAPVLLYHGDLDTTVPVSHIDLYAKAIPQAQARRLSNRNHQFNDDLAEVATDLLALG